MFGKRFKLFELVGFKVYVDLSWLVIATLIVWSLGAGIFPRLHPELSPAVCWIMGAFGALGLFASIILHELAHALVARRRGMQISGITLFIFGGVAEATDEPPDAASEFWVAIAGPVASVLLSAAFFGSHLLMEGMGVSSPVLGVTVYLAWINALLVAFNVIPAFPLDGGRVLRSALWAWKRDLLLATRIVSRLGRWFGLFLIGLGVFTFLLGNVIGGLWWFMIGLFLRQAAQLSYQQLLWRQALEGQPVKRFMHTDAVAVPASATLREFVDDYVYRHPHRVYPVLAGEQLAGSVSLEDVRQVPRDQWRLRTVNDLIADHNGTNTIHAETDAVQAIRQMNRNRVSRLMVVDDRNRLTGILALNDLSRFLAMKRELEGT